MAAIFNPVLPNRATETTILNSQFYSATIVTIAIYVDEENQSYWKSERGNFNCIALGLAANTE